MSMTALGWLLTILTLTAATPMVLAKGNRRASGLDALDVEACRKALKDIRQRLKRGLLTEDSADLERLALVLQHQHPGWLAFVRQGVSRPVVAAGAAFILVAGAGATASYGLRSSMPSVSAPHTASFADADDDVIAPLKHYAATLDDGGTGSAAAASPLADVDTMVTQLAARLDADPNDARGWQMLGWSYLQTNRYREAEAALQRAVALDPDNAELKRLLQDAAKGESAAVAPSHVAETPPTKPH